MGTLKKAHGRYFSLEQWMNRKQISDKFVLITKEELDKAWSAIEEMDSTTVDEDGLPSIGERGDSMMWILTNINPDYLTPREDGLIQKWVYLRAEALREQRPKEPYKNALIG